MDEKELEKKEDALKDNMTGGKDAGGDQEDSAQMRPLQGENSDDDSDDLDYLEEKDIDDEDELKALADTIKGTKLKVSVGGKPAGAAGQEKDEKQDAQVEGGTEKTEQQEQKETDEKAEKLDDAAKEASEAGVSMPATEGDAKGGGKEVVDEVDSEVGELMLNTMNEEGAEGKGDVVDEYFDTIQQLKTRKEKSQEEEPGNGDDNKPEADDSARDLWSKVEKYRDGNLYMAVVLARELEAGNHNPMQSSRASRFFNSSKFNKTSDVVKVVGLSSGVLGTFNSKYAASPVSKGISLVSNIMQLVTSIRDFVKKIKGFKFIQGKDPKDTKIEKIFSVIGMVSDLAMALSKGCAIAKAIAGFAGKSGGIFTKVMDYVSLFLNATSQIGGLLGGAKGLMKTKEGLSQLTTAEGKRWVDVEPLVREDQGMSSDSIEYKKALPEQKTEGEPPGQKAEEEPPMQQAEGENPVEKAEGENPVEKAEGEPPAKKPEGGPPAPQQQGGAPSAAGQEGKPAQTKQEREERRQAVTALLGRDDLSDADKTKAMRYLVTCRKYESAHAGLIKAATGLAAAAVGFGSSIATGVHYGVGNKTTGLITKYAGLAASLGGLGATGTKMALDKHTEDKRSPETSLIQARLMGGIQSLQENEYGLRGISESLLHDANDENKAKAQNALNKYAAVDGMFTGVDVDYGQLLKAPSIGAFQKLLITGI